MIKVRADLPTVIFATPKDPANQAYFAGVALPGTVPFTVNAASTAQALVFLSPLVSTSDPLLAQSVFEVIVADTNVKALGAVIGSRFPALGDPFEDAAFNQALEDAILSVTTSLQARSQSVSRDGRREARLQAGGNGAVVPLESYQTRYLELEGAFPTVKVSGVPFNPVDWIVVFEELDADRRFRMAAGT